MIETHELHRSTSSGTDILDLTDEIADCVRNSHIEQGQVTVFVPGSTAAVTTIEFESGCLHDLRRLFDEIVDPNRDYRHNERWHDGNGHSHVRAALLGPSLTVPFVQRRLTLGTWQQIIYLDFDNRPRRRELVVQIMGE